MKIKIIRSRERKKTISMREVNGVIQLYLPTGLSREEEFKYIQWAKKRVKSHRRKNELKEKDADKFLEEIARKLNKKYFGGELSWEKIYYSTEQNSRMFGNCDINDKIIKISDRLLKMPKFVHDYVVMHELAHLKVPAHNGEFWDLVNRYLKTERARGYLMATGMGD
ncbi:MAG: M48 family metallopeptidase [Candidatus Aenigmarchaeota archaeon]|nr:M48 family metallopeptidase [Candidatus Aenigmarchaeota archaeon]